MHTYLNLTQMKVLFPLLMLRFTRVNTDVAVKTKSGTVVGQLLTLDNGHKFNVFRGIPFAKPPINELRFTKPVPPDKWHIPMNVNQYRSPCISSWIPFTNPAPDPYKNEQSEDCLYLNIFAPHITNYEGHGYPVMVDIHGGNVYFGSAKWYKTTDILKHYVDKEVIVITIQYRLGIFGNHGLWDQALALKWIKENIKYFGGNSDSITIFGNSVMGQSTSILSIVPATNGLFQQVIQTDSLYSPWAFQNASTVKKNSYYLIEAIGCNFYSEKWILLSCLQQKPVDQLLKATEKSATGGSWYYDIKLYKMSFTRFGPIFDGSFLREGALLPKSPELLVKTAPKRNTIIGATALEPGLHLSAFLDPHTFKIKPNSDDIGKMPQFEVSHYFEKDYVLWYIREVVVRHYDLSPTVNNIIKQQIFEFYFPDPTVSANDLLHSFTELLNDVMFKIGSYKEAKMKFENGFSVWFYEFDDYLPIALDNKKTSNSKELPYLWGKEAGFYYFAPIDQNNNNNNPVPNSISTLWTNFAKFGDPTQNSVDGIRWKKLSARKPSQYLLIKHNQLNFKSVFHPKSVKFWLRTVPDII